MKNALIDPVTLTFDLSIPKSYHFYDIPRTFPTPSSNTFLSFIFEIFEILGNILVSLPVNSSRGTRLMLRVLGNIVFLQLTLLSVISKVAYYDDADKQTDRQIDGRTDGQTNRQTRMSYPRRPPESPWITRLV